MKKSKKLGNEIKWYKPFSLVRRNKDLEQLAQTQFEIINSLEDDLKKEKNKKNDKSVDLNKLIVNQALKENIVKDNSIKNLEYNIQVLRNTSDKIISLCKKENTEFSNTILKELGITIIEQDSKKKAKTTSVKKTTKKVTKKGNKENE